MLRGDFRNLEAKIVVLASFTNELAFYFQNVCCLSICKEDSLLEEVANLI